MRGFLFVLSILWIVLGTAMVLYTDQARKSFKDMFAGASIRIVAIFPSIMGLLLVIGAFMVREVFWLALILGILALGKGLLLAFGPLAQIREYLDWWFDKAGETVIRLWGLIVFMIGVAMFSWLV